MIKVTGVSPDTYRDYQIEATLPELHDELVAVRNQLDAAITSLRALTGKKSDKETTLLTMRDQLDDLIRDGEYFVKVIGTYKINVRACGNWITSVIDQPLAVDRINIYSADVDVKYENTSFWSKLVYEIKRLFYSFIIDYNQIGNVAEEGIPGKNILFSMVVLSMMFSWTVTQIPQCVAPDGLVYVADTKNNRIVVLSADMTALVRIIDSFDRDGSEDTFNAPYGVCVSENNQLYVADSNNKRVVVLTPEGEFVKIIDNPQSEILEEGFDFVPLKVTVDYADRVYVIAKNAFEGILVFESTGDFTGYFGTIDVKITLWEKFWRRLASKEERSKQLLFIPTEFTGIDIDSDGFVYASNIDSDGVQGVRRLNPRGEDVIQKGENENLGGDLIVGMFGTYAGPSEFTDVVYRGRGIYSLLDRKRGRIFTYDKEGNLLYIFGGLGSQEGTFNTPVAIEAVDDMIIVLDAYSGAILKFSETEYGSLINDAVGLRYDGDETQAIEKWQGVLEAK